MHPLLPFLTAQAASPAGWEEEIERLQQHLGNSLVLLGDILLQALPFWKEGRESRGPRDALLCDTSRLLLEMRAFSQRPRELADGSEELPVAPETADALSTLLRQVASPLQTDDTARWLRGLDAVQGLAGRLLGSADSVRTPWQEAPMKSDIESAADYAAGMSWAVEQYSADHSPILEEGESRKAFSHNLG